MKKYLLMITLLFTSLFICTGEVDAKRITMCKYKNSGSKKSITIDFDSSNNKYYFSYVGSMSSEDDITVSTSKGALFWKYNLLEMSDPATKALYRGECPRRAFLDLNGYNELCLDNNTSDGKTGHCYDAGFNIKKERLHIDIDAFKETLSDLEDQLDDISFTSDSCDVYNEVDGENYMRNKIKDVVSTVSGDFPEAFENHVNGLLDDEYNEELLTRYNAEMAGRCIEEVQNDDTLTEEEKQEKIDNITVTKAELNSALDGLVNNLFEFDYEGELYCGFIGEKTWKYIQDLYSLIKLLIPAIIVLLGILDFMKVVLSGEEKDMKTSGVKFMKRLAAGIIFILLPILLEFLVHIVGFSENCIGKL